MAVPDSRDCHLCLAGQKSPCREISFSRQGLLKILFHNQMTKNKVGAIITERRCKVLQMIGVEYEMVYEIWYLEKDIDDTGGNLLRHIFNQRCCFPDDIQ